MDDLPQDIQRIINQVGSQHKMAVEDIRFPLPASRILTSAVRDIVKSVNMFWDFSKNHKTFLAEIKSQCSRQNVRLPHGGDLELLVKLLGLPLDVHETVTDGNCGPASAVDQLAKLSDLSEDEANILRAWPQNARQKQLRFLVSTTMMYSKEEYVEQYKEAYNSHDKVASLVKGVKEKHRWPSYNAMWTAMGKDHTWVEEGFWQALALALERDIHMVNLEAHPSRPFMTFSGNRMDQHKLQEERSPLFIGYRHPKHYWSLQLQPFARPTMLDIVRAHKSGENVPVIVYIDPLTEIVTHNLKPR